MKKYLFTILFFSSISLIADNVDPTNYVNQVVSDTYVIMNQSNDVESRLLSAYSYLSSIDRSLLDPSDASRVQNAQDALLWSCGILQTVWQTANSLRYVASGLVLSSGSGGGTYTNIINNTFSPSITNINIVSVQPYITITNIVSGGSYGSVDLNVVSNFYRDANSLLTSLVSTISAFRGDFSYYGLQSLTNNAEVADILNGISTYLTRYQYSYLRNLNSVFVTQTNQLNEVISSVDSINRNIQLFYSDFSSVTGIIQDILDSINTSNTNTSQIVSHLTTIRSFVVNTYNRLDDILSFLVEFESYFEEFYRIFTDLHSNFGGSFWNLRNGNVTTSLWNSDYTYHWLGFDGGELYTDYWEPFPSNPQRLTFYSFLQWYLDNLPAYFSSLNNYAFTNMTLLGTIANKNFSAFNTNSIDVSSITSSIYSATDILTNSLARHFTIFDNSSPLLDFHNASGNTTNQYYHFLTNYYIKVSTGNASGSASESHTNWFNRIEMLLGALVFKDSSDGSFTPGSTDMDGVENVYDSISQSLATAVEIPSSFQSKIENAEQSILDYMREWHSIISSGTLGSHFTLCDVQLSGFDSEPTRDGGATFDGRMNLTIPIDGSLKNFLDVARALSTVCFITLFLILSLKLIIFLLRACASITRVCYALFMAIAGH